MQIFFPPGDGDEIWHPTYLPVKTNDISVRRVFTCAQWGVGVRAKISYFGEIRSTSVFFSYMIGMLEVEVRHYPK